MPRKQHGYALLEGLVSLALLSFGVLGVIGLQASMLAHNTHSQMRIQASLLANELVGMATADAANAGCYVVNGDTAPACSSTKAARLAQEWEQRVRSVLPGNEPPTAALDAGGNFTVTLLWKRQQEAATHNYVVVTRIAP